VQKRRIEKLARWAGELVPRDRKQGYDGASASGCAAVGVRMGEAPYSIATSTAPTESSASGTCRLRSGLT
jgi:hypothetical protein